MAETVYVCRSAPNLKVKLSFGYVKFEHGSLELEDKDQIKEFDDLISEKVALSSKIEKLDRKAAEAIAKAHMEATRRPAAGKGGDVVGHQLEAAHPEQISKEEAAALKKVGMIAAAGKEEKK